MELLLLLCGNIHLMVYGLFCLEKHDDALPVGINLMPTMQSECNGGAAALCPEAGISCEWRGGKKEKDDLVAMVTTWLERRHMSSGSGDGAAQGPCAGVVP